MTQQSLFSAALALAALCAVSAYSQTQNPGTLDTSFNPVLAPSYINGVYATRVQADGKILLGGDFTTVNGQTARSVARLTGTGALDSSFVSNPGADGTVWALAEMADGRIVLGGSFNNLNGASWRGVARLMSTGTPDTAFGQFSGVNGTIHAVAVQADQKILVGGSFTTVNGTARSYLARLNSNGSLDANFTPLLDGLVLTIAARPNGRVLVGGSFLNVNNTGRKYMVQLNADGSTDSQFNSTVDWDVNCIVLQTNGQAVLGGWFGYVGGAAHNYLARVNTDGSPDSAFTAASSGIVYSLAVQPNGKIVVGGRFSTMNGTAKPNLALLNNNGLLDPSFNTGVGPDYTVRAISLQSDGKLVIGGEFKNVSMVSRTYTARIWGDPPPPVIPADAVQIWAAVEVGWTSKSNVNYQVQWSPEATPTQWQNLGLPIIGIGGFMNVFDSTRAHGRRFYRVIEAGQ